MKRKIKKMINDYSEYGKRFGERFAVSLCIVLILVCVCYMINMRYGILNYVQNDQMNVYDMLYAQASLSFIVISLITILSDDTQTVYWKNLVKERLINPPWFSFVDITAYIMAMVLLSTIFAFANSWLIVIPFVMCLVLLGLLTFKLTGSYFGKEEMKNTMRNSFLNMDISEKIKAEEKLVEYTIAAFERSDFSTVYDNLLFLIENARPFKTEICFEVMNNKSKALTVNAIGNMGYQNVCQHSFLRKKIVELIISLQNEQGLYASLHNLLYMYIHAPFLYLYELTETDEEKENYLYFSEFPFVLKSLDSDSLNLAKKMIEFYCYKYEELSSSLTGTLGKNHYPAFDRYLLILLPMEEVCEWVCDYTKDNGYNDTINEIIDIIFSIKTTVEKRIESYSPDNSRRNELKKRLHRLEYADSEFANLKEIEIPDDDFYKSTKKRIEEMSFQ